MGSVAGLTQVLISSAKPLSDRRVERSSGAAMGTDTKRREAEPGGDQGDAKVGHSMSGQHLHYFEKRKLVFSAH